MSEVFFQLSTVTEIAGYKVQETRIPNSLQRKLFIAFWDGQGILVLQFLAIIQHSGGSRTQLDEEN
jgi:hypothetical protein